MTASGIGIASIRSTSIVIITTNSSEFTSLTSHTTVSGAHRIIIARDRTRRAPR